MWLVLAFSLVPELTCNMEHLVGDNASCHVLGSKFKVHYKIDYGGESVLSITVTVAYYVDKYFYHEVFCLVIMCPLSCTNPLSVSDGLVYWFCISS